MFGKRSAEDEAYEAELERLAKQRQKQDLKEIINLILQSPLKEKGEVIQANGDISLQTLSKENTDVQTRIILQMAKDAATGNVKSAEFLMRYAGKEPPKQQQITMELPTLIDDITFRETPVVASTLAHSEEEEEEDEDE